MPRRDDLQKILLIGSGPIVIGQAAEFDYSGVQACKVLREEGYEVILVNSNPATIMTDPEFADRTYVEPLTLPSVRAIIERERPDALLPTLGGQTALNLAMELREDGVLDRLGVEMIGANHEAIRRAEDREEFRKTMEDSGLRVPWSVIVTSVAEVEAGVADGSIELPAIVRPAFTLGGQGGGVGNTPTELLQVVSEGLAASPINQVLVEESVIGWGEFELELMRDLNDNVVVICSIENVDPMGVHTGDSVTIAPAQTLTDALYQELRNQAIKVIRAVGVETGGSNIQFAVNPKTGEIVVIEMNPRVSRSSALASKATGFPIAKIAAKLAVGYALEEIPNDITRATPASFEPTIDYVVTKIPRFAFEKFPGAEGELTTHMKSVGEAMAIGRTFRESFAKAMRSRELDSPAEIPEDTEALLKRLETPSSDRFDLVHEAFLRDCSWRSWRPARHQPLVPARAAALAREGDGTEGLIRGYRAVDTCAAEFEAATPYYYSAHERSGPPRRGPPGRSRPSGRDSRLGPQPDRAGHRVRLLLRARRDDRARIGPRRRDDQLQPGDGLDGLRHLGSPLLRAAHRRGRAGGDRGRTAGGRDRPVRRPDAAAAAAELEQAGVQLLGTPVDAIDLAEDRGRFGALLRQAGDRSPAVRDCPSADEALEIAEESASRFSSGPPTSSVAGRWRSVTQRGARRVPRGERQGRSRSIRCSWTASWRTRSRSTSTPSATARGQRIGGIMQHVEEAGVHSGDSACVIPPMSLGAEMLDEIREHDTAHRPRAGRDRADQHSVRGRRRQALRDRGQPPGLAHHAVRLEGDRRAAGEDRLPADAGRALSDQQMPERPRHVSVKEAVLPFARFAGADSILGPEMKSTGEVMGVAATSRPRSARPSRPPGSRCPKRGRSSSRSPTSTRPRRHSSPPASTTSDSR